MEDIAYVAAGSTPSKEHFVDKGIPYIKMYNLRNQKIDFDFQPQYIDRETHEGKLARSKTEPGDILMNIVGPPLGKIAIIPESLPEANFNQAAVLIRPYCYKNIIAKYLQLYLEQMDEINSISTKGSAGQVNISLSQSQNMRVPLPPLHEQERIISKLEEYDCILETLNANIKATYNTIDLAKSKILELAITGQLVLQNPDDEPASELLKRINPKAEIITDNEHYPQLPDNWVICRLKDVCNYGKTQQVAVNEIGDNEWILELEDIEKDSGNIITRHRKNDRSVNGVRNRFAKGMVLYSKLRTYLNKVLVADAGGFCSTEIVPIQTHAVVLPEYLCAVLRSPQFLCYAAQCGYGVKMPRLSTNDAHKALIPVPPYQEQLRIATAINRYSATLDAIKDCL